MAGRCLNCEVGTDFGFVGETLDFVRYIDCLIGERNLFGDLCPPYESDSLGYIDFRGDDGLPYVTVNVLFAI